MVKNEKSVSSIEKMLFLFKIELDKHNDINLIQELGEYAITCVEGLTEYTNEERQSLDKGLSSIICEAIDRVESLEQTQRWLKQINLKPYAPNLPRRAV